MPKFNKNKKVYIDKDGEFRLTSVAKDFTNVTVGEGSAVDSSLSSNIKYKKYRIKAVDKNERESEFVTLDNIYDVPVYFDELNQYRLKSVDIDGLSSDWSSVLFFVNENGLISHSNEPIQKFIDEIFDVYTEDFLSEIFVDTLVEDGTYKKLVDDIDLLINNYSQEFIDLYAQDNIIEKPSLENYVEEVISSDAIVDRIAIAMSNIIEDDYFDVNSYEESNLWMMPRTLEDLLEYSVSDMLEDVFRMKGVLDRSYDFLSDYVSAYTYNSEGDISKINAALISFIDNIVEDEIKDLFISIARKDKFTYLTDDIITLITMSFTFNFFDLEFDNDFYSYLNCKNLDEFELDGSKLFNNKKGMDFYDKTDNFNPKDLVEKYQAIVRSVKTLYKSNINDNMDYIFNPHVFDTLLLYFLDELSDIDLSLLVDDQYLSDVNAAVNILAFKGDDVEGYLETEFKNTIDDIGFNAQVLPDLDSLVEYDIYGFAVYIVILKMHNLWNVSLEDNSKHYINNENNFKEVKMPFDLKLEDGSIIKPTFKEPERDKLSIGNHFLNKNMLSVSYNEQFYFHKGDVDSIESEEYSLFDIMGKSVMGMTPLGYEGKRELPSNTKRYLQVW